MSNNQNQRHQGDFSSLLGSTLNGISGDGSGEFNPIALFLSMPILIIAIIGLIWEFLRQPTTDKVAQIGLGCLYVFGVILCSPCACAIWIIQAIAS